MYFNGKVLRNLVKKLTEYEREITKLENIKSIIKILLILEL